jgi:hypothetical protein
MKGVFHEKAKEKQFFYQTDHMPGTSGIMYHHYFGC